MPEIFGSIAWGRSGVLSQTVARLRRRRTRYALGPAWYDVDRWSDVALLAAHLERMKMRAGARIPAPPLPCPATARVLKRLGLLRTGR
jgi:hypothetical protein